MWSSLGPKLVTERKKLVKKVFSDVLEAVLSHKYPLEKHLSVFKTTLCKETYE